MAGKILLIADTFHPSLMDRLSEHNIPFEYRPEIDREGILTALRNGCSGLVLRSKIRVDRELLEHSKSLRFIARGGAGMDNIDEETAFSLGIDCFNAGEANSDAVGEHTIGMMLGLLHHIAKGDREIRRNEWNREGNRGLELRGKTVGIIGFGNTGSAVAKKLSGFGVKILAYDKNKKGYGNDQIQECNLEEIFRDADIVTLHIPLDGHTRFMINSEFIQSFVRKIFLLNLSRGEIVNTRDVISGLKSDKIAGFAADVLENEDPQGMGDSDRIWFDELKKRDDVLLTPHVAGWSAESYRKISEVLADKIIARWA